MTANEKGESTGEATVYGDDLDVFVTMMLLEDSIHQQCYLLVYGAKKWEWKV